MGNTTFIDNDNLGKFEETLRQELNTPFLSGQKIAIKLHMGEKGNNHYLKPDLVRAVVDVLMELGCKPFLFDSPVVYPGGRDTCEKYYETAKEHGFTEEKIGCPIIISNEFKSVKTEHLDAGVCKPLIESDGLLVLTHVKGHMCSGFGGAIKNLGMGGVARKTKQDIHNLSAPVIAGECVSCGCCVKACPVGAVSLKEKAVFEYSRCWGCGVCISACPSSALKPKMASFDRLIAEGASAVLKDIKNSYYINVLKDITKLCDCCSNPGGIVLYDIGILMGSDIISVEKASFDMINDQAGKDLFKEIHKKTPLNHIKEGELLGLGRMGYELIEK